MSIVMGCGHVHLPNNAGIVGLTDAWCSDCARQINKTNQGLAHALLEERRLIGVLGLICAIYAWREGRLLDIAARALVAQGRAESAIAWAAHEALSRHRTFCCTTDAEGRYVAEIETLPDVSATGVTEDEARANARSRGFTVILDLIRTGQPFLPLG